MPANTPPSLLDEPANRARLTDAEGRIAGNRVVFDSLVRHALERHAAGDAVAAISVAAGAARFAYGLHAGLFASEPLETMLLEIGRNHVAAPPRAAGPPHAGRDRVLHVFTETYAVGGHTRLAQRWIDLDATRTHSVFVTAARDDIPAWLSDAVGRRGGTVRTHRRPESPLARAAALREAAASADLVVLHVHPYDPVPLLAFADPRGRPPVVLLNHADHTFWLGVGVADVVADIRRPGAELTTTRRGVAPGRSRVLGIPVAPEGPEIEAGEARRRLGIDPERPLLCTIASAYKFAPVVAPAFQELAVAAATAVPDAILIAVGPSADERWAWARDATCGRVAAVGAQTEVRTLLAAADVYLDSWPCASGTSMLDAATAGLPLVALVPDQQAQGLLAMSAPALDDLIVRCATPTQHAAAVAELVGDPQRRRRLGSLAQQRLAEQHTGAGWLDSLEDVIATAHAVGPVPAPVAVPDTAPVAWEAILEGLHGAGGIGLAPRAALELEGADPGAWQPDLTAPRRAVAAPRLEREAVAAVVDGFRVLQRQRRIGDCVVVVAPEDLGAAVPLLEAALAAGEDIDIDVVQVPALDRVLRSDDICLVEDGTPEARLARAMGADLQLMPAA